MAARDEEQQTAVQDTLTALHDLSSPAAGVVAEPDKPPERSLTETIDALSGVFGMEDAAEQEFHRVLGVFALDENVVRASGLSAAAFVHRLVDELIEFSRTSCDIEDWRELGRLGVREERWQEWRARVTACNARKRYIGNVWGWCADRVLDDLPLLNPRFREAPGPWGASATATPRDRADGTVVWHKRVTVPPNAGGGVPDTAETEAALAAFLTEINVDADKTLYFHGTHLRHATNILDVPPPVLSTENVRGDFGGGLYTTRRPDDAIGWMCRSVNVTARSLMPRHGAIIVFETTDAVWGPGGTVIETPEEFLRVRQTVSDTMTLPPAYRQLQWIDAAWYSAAAECVDGHQRVCRVDHLFQRLLLAVKAVLVFTVYNAE